MSKELFPSGVPATYSGMQALAFHAYSEMLRLRNYSPNTIRSYTACFSCFLKHFGNRRPSEISKYEIMDYLAGARREGRWSGAAQNMHINAIKFFF